MTQPPSPPGWYPDPLHAGGQRWWDGQGWTQHQVGPTPRPIKSLGVAWVLALFLGMVGAHLYYIRRPWMAVTLSVLWLGGTAASVTTVDHTSPVSGWASTCVGIAFVLYLVSLFMIGPEVRRINYQEATGHLH